MEAIDAFLSHNLTDLIIFIALCLVIIGAARIIRHKGYDTWSLVKATIIELDETYKIVALSQYSNMKHYYPVINYAYTFDNKQYTSTAVSSNIRNIWVPENDDWGVPINEQSRFWFKWKPGDIIDVYVNTKKPTDSVIIKDLHNQYKSHNYALILSGALLSLIWLFLKVYA